MTFKCKNSNYGAVVVKIKTLLPLVSCDNVVGAQILGNQVIVGKDIKIGDIGIYFPLECQLSKEYLSVNNLYKHAELNADTTRKGYFEDNGRIKCMKFRSHKSEGLYMPLSSINFTDLKADYGFHIGDEFDELNGIEICCKYVIKARTPGTPGSGKNKNKTLKISKLIENQFRFHQETNMLYKNLHKINPNDLIQISYKMHGTSSISSRILCKKQLKWYERLLKKLGVNIIDTEYSNIYASRKVIKNEDLNPDAVHYYDVDIWGLANEKLKEFLTDGISLYYEIVGYLPTGAMIQKDYDYGYVSPFSSAISKFNQSFGIYIYRITSTNISGKVIEFSAKQVQDWCHYKGLNAVPQLFYGYAKDFLPITEGLTSFDWGSESDVLKVWQETFLVKMRETYNEKDCYMCSTKVPEEGVVIRIEHLEFEAYKCKSFAFLSRETKELDKGESDIESEN